MGSNKIDLLNILLLVFSLLVATLLPFETFLFAYAILGPLHYLTEINWLNNRNYFVKSKKKIWILILLTVLISIPTLIYGIFVIGDNSLVHKIIRPLQQASNELILISFITSIGLVYLQKRKQLITFLLFALGLTYFIQAAPFYSILIGVFLPTLVHVYLFTLAFMLHGILKRKNIMGVLSFTLALFCPFIIFVLPVEWRINVTDQGVISQYLESNFKYLSITIAGLFTNEEASPEKLMVSKLGIQIQTFIAFAFLYHYLNWFSKISLIGWLKNTSGKELILIGIAWLFSVLLYYYNYQLGFTLLFFMSLLHVVLEFPLNVICIREILSSSQSLWFSRGKKKQKVNNDVKRKISA